MHLGAHLRSDVSLLSGEAHLSRFVQLVSERFLAEDMLSTLERRHGDRCVHVIRRGHVTRVDVLVVDVEHLPEVVVAPGSRKLFRRGVERAVVDVAQGHDLAMRARGDLPQIDRSHAPHTHTGVADLAVGRITPRDGGSNRWRHHGGGCDAS